MADRRAIKAGVLIGLGPISGLLAIETLEHARRGDWLGATAHFAAVPATSFLLARGVQDPTNAAVVVGLTAMLALPVVMGLRGWLTRRADARTRIARRLAI